MNKEFIKNKEALLSHGNTYGRKIALELIESGIAATDPYAATKRLVQFDSKTLMVSGLRFETSEIGKIYVIGAGKATLPIAKALEEILGENIEDGIIIVKRGQEGSLRKIRIYRAGHPIPDEDGLRGAQSIVRLAGEVDEKDIVFCAITGGSSALMPLPAEGITLQEKQKVTELLLRSGAVIQEINAVRKHISAIKGGRLAQMLGNATIINLTVSDVVGDWAYLDCITDNTVPDSSTFSDAVRVLKKYSLWDKVPKSVRERLSRADPREETPKTLPDAKIHTFMLATNSDACEGARIKGEELGLNSVVLSTMVEGESREAGIAFSGIAREVELYDRPIKSPCAIITGGETTVTIEGEHGEGGPNQEFALGLALKIGGSKRITAASIGTDGTDGPTEIAGGIVDGYTLNRAEMMGIELYNELRRHNSSYVLRRLEDAIYTGSTGTNVMNLRVMIVN